MCTFAFPLHAMSLGAPVGSQAAGQTEVWMRVKLIDLVFIGDFIITLRVFLKINFSTKVGLLSQFN